MLKPGPRVKLHCPGFPVVTGRTDAGVAVQHFAFARSHLRQSNRHLLIVTCDLIVEHHLRDRLNRDFPVSPNIQVEFELAGRLPPYLFVKAST